MGLGQSRQSKASSGSPEVPPPTSTVGPNPVTNASTSEDNKQPESKREPHMFEKIIGGEKYTQDEVSKGVLLADKKKKYWVDSKKNNCFMLFPRGLSITWGENSSYWTYTKSDAAADGGVELAELKDVCWLEIRGQLEVSHLTPGVTYEVLFEVKIKENSYGWGEPVNLRLKFPDGRTQEGQKDLRQEPKETWQQLKVGDIKTRKGQSGELAVSLFEYGGHWKRGLVIKGIKIIPKE